MQPFTCAGKMPIWTLPLEIKVTKRNCSVTLLAIPRRRSRTRCLKKRGKMERRSVYSAVAAAVSDIVVARDMVIPPTILQH
jgi:hypothetical protein